MEPLWNLLKTIEIRKRVHRARTFFTSFAQVFSQAISKLSLVFLIN